MSLTLIELAAGVIAGVTVREMMPFRLKPASSLSMSVMMYEPAAAYGCKSWNVPETVGT